ncbi:hypothetical protein FOMPIDRAFT_1044862 [Fomitopsis schrenkii]|uniref:RING-type domain-containing protein n=1 Tax=Fomitopsis schrenkii TaxID=2126942 RepID=S8FWN7_FOMSC|nr:hypothetical protein FOMPIDRAFT_1044862 [Fomitopsis schrenkii]
MPLRQALTAPWRGIQSYPYLHQFLLANVFSRFFFFAATLDLGIVDLRRLIYDPQYVVPRIDYILVPELTGTPGVIYMASAYIVTFLLVEISWRMGTFADRIRTSSRVYSWQAKAVSVTWRHMIPVVLMMEVARAVARIRGLLVLDLIWMSVSVVVLGRFTWPVLRANMIIRDRRVKEARVIANLARVSRVSRLAEAFPVVRRCHIPTDDDCPICLVPFGKVSCAVVRTPGCGHVFCKNCIAKWIVQSKGRCPVCRHDVYPDLEASAARFYGFSAFPRLILRTTIDIWDIITMPVWNAVAKVLSVLVQVYSSIVSIFRTVLGFVTSLCRLVTSDLIWLINELAEANEPPLDTGRASETNSKDGFDAIQKHIEELVMMMQAQSSQVSQMTGEQLRQAQDIRTLAATLERMQWGRSVAEVAPASVSKGDETRGHARLSVV